MDEAVRRRWVPFAAAVLVVALLLIAGWAVLGHRGAAGAEATPAASGSASATGTPGAVELPPCADQSATNKMLLATTPDGPARDAVAGSTVRTSFSLGNGAFTADPPPAGYVPSVSAQQAGCQLAAAMGVRGFTAAPGRLALATVTIASGLQFQSSVGAGERFANAYHGPLPSYQRRVAWILISAADNDISSCPTRGPSASQAAVASAEPAHPYEVFGIDATTGASPIMYEDPYALCQGISSEPASVSVPYQILSVPWTMVSRAADGSSAQISASWSSCQVYTWTGTTYATSASTASGAPPQPATSASQLHAWVQRTNGDVSITVGRPFGADCGPPTATA